MLAAGYAPAVGFIHTGKPLSFVYDVADVVKFETVIPIAFQVAKRAPAIPEREVRLACRDAFRQSKILGRLIPLIEDILAGKGTIDADSAFLGVVTTNVSDQPAAILRRFGIDLDKGAFVTEVQSGSAADEAGLQAGDVITKIDGKAIDSNQDVGTAIRSKKPGDEITLDIFRDGSDTSSKATLQRRGG